VKRGDAWGEPAPGGPDLEVAGGDADLAGIVATHPGALVRFRPDASSDLARSVGAAAGAAATGMAVPIDALVATPGGTGVNAVIVGTAPARVRASTRSIRARVEVDGRLVAARAVTTVVVASGQFVDGLDVVPRGHPGDGRLEVQVYALRRGERRAMRSRLPQGVHVPHPRITTAVGRRVRVVMDRDRAPLTIDGVARDAVDEVTVEVLPAALRLLL
jgi:diacylglycerol kinase family enzyme